MDTLERIVFIMLLVLSIPIGLCILIGLVHVSLDCMHYLLTLI